MFEPIRGYKDSNKMIEQCFNNIKEYYYNIADAKLHSINYNNWIKARNMFRDMKDFRDSSDKIRECEAKMKKHNKVGKVIGISIIIAYILFFVIGFICSKLT